MSLHAFDNLFRTSRLNVSRDFRPDWDVPTLNERASAELVQEIRRLRGRTQPDPGQMISILLSAPGYGKTHLFGRIAHMLGDDVFFVFVEAVPPGKPMLDHIHWYLVESLFDVGPGGRSPIARALARLCQSSLADYFAQLPASLAARHQTLQQRLQGDPAAAFEVIEPVKGLHPFRKLADSLVPLFPQIPAGIVRALAFGWAPEPWPTHARRWLRGETLPDDEQECLGLGDDPPAAMDVIRAVPAILGPETPMVICCDQLESVLRDKSAGANARMHFSDAAVNLLQGVPVAVVVSCLEGEWPGFYNEAYGAFKMRVRRPEYALEMLTPDQGVELVRRRLAHWEERPAGRDGIWPFDGASIQIHVAKEPNPRVLIQECARRLDDWDEEGREGLIEIGRDGDKPDPGVLFLREWNKELEAIRTDSKRSALERQEERLFWAVKEALTIARDAGGEMGGIRVKNIQEEAAPQNLLKLELASGGVNYGALVAVTKIEASLKFRWFYRAFEAALQHPGVAGGVLIHPRRDFPMGDVTRDRFQRQQKAEKIRLFPLLDNAAAYEHLECLVTLLDRADAQGLQFGKQSLTADDVRRLAVETHILDQLDVFKSLADWPAPARAPSASARVAQPVEVGVGAMSGTGVGVADASGGNSTGVAGPTAPDPVAAAEEWAEERLRELVEKLGLWGQPVEPVGVELGPTFARLKVRPAGAKTTFKLVSNKGVDLRIHLGLGRQPIIDSQAGHISVDVQLPRRRTVTLAEAWASLPSGKDDRPIFPVGQDVSGRTHWLDLAEPADCHILVAGTTGSGKSEFLRALIAALACRLSYEQVQFVLIDPKRVTFNIGEESPYLLCPVAHDLDEALPLVQECLDLTKERFALLEKRKLSNVSELQETELLPRIVLVIDEFANLMEDKGAKKVFSSLLKQIGSMARAAGIHLVVATQRPDKDVVQPILRDNLPGRIALQVPGEAGSKLILDSPEAAYLLGKGDLLWKHGGSLLRLQSPFVAPDEFEDCLKIT